MKTIEQFQKDNGSIYQEHNPGEVSVIMVNREDYKAIQLDAFKAGMEQSAKLVRERGEYYDAEHGNTDRETGNREYPKGGDEYMMELSEIEELILTTSQTLTELPNTI